MCTFREYLNEAELPSPYNKAYTDKMTYLLLNTVRKKLEKIKVIRLEKTYKPPGSSSHYFYVYGLGKDISVRISDHLPGRNDYDLHVVGMSRTVEFEGDWDNKGIWSSKSPKDIRNTADAVVADVLAYNKNK